MKRFLGLNGLYCVAALLLIACGDDAAGGADAGVDGGEEFLDLRGLNNAVEDLNNNLEDVTAELDDVSGNVEDLGSNLEDLADDVGALDDRITMLENPHPVSCSLENSVEEQCMPDGIDIVRTRLQPIIERLCALEVDCCNADELLYKFGPGITTVEQCTTTFVDLVNNGFSPDFLEQNGYLVQSVIQIAHALNNTRVKLEIDTEAVGACLDALANRACPTYAAPGEPEPLPDHCEPRAPEDFLVPEGDSIVPECQPSLLVHGLQQAGQVCGVVNVAISECDEGLTCRSVDFESSLCATPAAPGEHCTKDAHCDGEDMFCSHASGQCELRRVAGEDCAYVDPTFTVDSDDLHPGFVSNSVRQNHVATSIECTDGYSCDPVTHTCVQNCSSGSFCNPDLANGDCPAGMTCNVTEVPNLFQTFRLGACRPALQEGDPCTLQDNLHECESDHCAEGNDGATCVPPLLAEGADCALATAGIGEPNTECESGYCAVTSSSSTTGACASRCTDNSECPATHFCDLDTLELDFTHGDDYYACDVKRANAGPCNGNPSGPGLADDGVDEECESGYCAGAACAPKGGLWATCASGRHSECPSTQYCGAGTTCTDFVPTDGACTSDYACGAGKYCWNNAGALQCRPFGAVGDDCSAGRRCDPSVDDNVCVAVGVASRCHVSGAFPTGADCAEQGDLMCADGWCRTNDNTCSVPIAEGEDCVTSNPAMNRCAAGLYCKTAFGETAGRCTAQNLAGQSCEPRYEGRDCLHGVVGSCMLVADAFVCSSVAIEPETLFCDGA